MCGLGYLFMGKIFGSMSLSPESPPIAGNI